MAEFESPRFAGDPVLEEILNDPDTGTLKLQPGSPEDSVMRLQQALFDLTWTLRITPPVHEESDFVVGVYGPVTTETVLAYKTHYGIRFPSSDPEGFVDGLAGPGTFAKLDPQCVLLDEAIVAISQKVDELLAAGTPVQLTALTHATLPIDASSGTFSIGKIDGVAGAIYFKRGVGAFEVHGRIFDAYFPSGPVGGFGVGFPMSDEHAHGAGFRQSDFENGSLRLDLATGRVEPVELRPGADEEPVF
jgi:hypothetical protein